MKFWDASALVPLIVDQRASTRVQFTAEADPGMIVWWGSQVECASALARLEREGSLEGPSVDQAFTRLRRFAPAWNEIDPSDTVREAAIRFLRVHPLRAADSLQLAAAFVASEGRPSTLEIVTLDDRLGTAARKEGFVVVDLASAAPAGPEQAPADPE